MEGHLTGRTALVTGANCGIGAATALELSNRGVSVLLTYLRLPAPPDSENMPFHYGAARARDAAWVVEAIRSGGGRAEALEADLADPATPRASSTALKRGLDRPRSLSATRVAGYRTPSTARARTASGDRCSR